MCRSIKRLYNFDSPVTEEEIRNASLQFVRKISGFQKPSKVNEKAFNKAVDKMSLDVRNFLETLETSARPKSR